MMEALLMGSGVQGPLSAWQFVGSETALSRGVFGVGTGFPQGIQEDDLVIAVMSPLYDDVGTSMISTGEWTHWVDGSQDYLCSARYSAELAIPVWQKSAANTLFVSTLVFRAPGWTTVQLESDAYPARPISIETRTEHQLLLNIGITPRTGSWAGSMPGLVSSPRISRGNAPGLAVYTASIGSPRQISGIFADSSSGPSLERNLILTAF